MKIVKIPAENGLGKTIGTAKAPDILTKDLDQSKIEQIQVNNENLQEQQEQISKQALKLFQTKERPLFIGGDHSLTYPTAKAFLSHYKNQSPCLIILDAHVDLMPPMKEPTHEEFLRALIESNLPTQNILILGSREIDPEEKRYLKEKNIKTITIKEIQDQEEETVEQIINFTKNSPLYLSIDIDILSPEQAPATGYPSPNGLTKQQLFSLLSPISKLPNLKALDLTEINPTLPGSKETIEIGKEILDFFK